MVNKKILSDHCTNKLFAAVAGLCDNSCNSDVTIQVGDVDFQCHKLILALQSTYFQQHLFQTPQLITFHQIPLKDVTSEDFKNVQNFMYRGEIDLDSKSVCRVVRLVKFIRLDELKQICFQFMTDTLDLENCVQYWKLVVADQYGSDLRARCLELFVLDFAFVASTDDLQEVTEDMMEAAIKRDDLNVSSEMDVCEILMKWFDVNVNLGRSVIPLKLFSLIRWSGVPLEYIKSKIIHRDFILKDRQCFDYLSKVISYRINGTQFEGLRTHHRPSTGLETCVVVVGTNNGITVTNECYRVGLHRQHSVAITSIKEAAVGWGNACVGNNQMFVCGVGTSYKETWRWDSVGVWVRCGDMVEGRCRHSVSFVGSTSIYVLGGFVESADSILSTVQEFDTIKNKWKTVGETVYCVRSAGCVSFKLSVYVFGGIGEEDASLNLIQVFDVTTKQCSVLTLRLPRPECLLRTALWDNLVVLMNNRTSFSTSNRTSLNEGISSQPACLILDLFSTMKRCLSSAAATAKETLTVT